MDTKPIQQVCEERYGDLIKTVDAAFTEAWSVGDSLAMMNLLSVVDRIVSRADAV